MTVKVGDIVRYSGCNVRVMRIGSSIVLSYFGLVNDRLDNFELIESYNPPKFEVGDKITICEIPKEERAHYGPGWRSEMTEMIGSTQIVTEVRDDEHIGRRVKLGSWWFQIYHLEPEYNYDII